MFEASVPGNLVLMGEHAVLQGYPALGLAIDKRMVMRLTPREDATITLHSALGVLKTDLTRLKVHAPFEFVLTALLSYQPKLTQGCDIVIESEFTPNLGLGSSACATLLVHALISRWLQRDVTPMQLYQNARLTVQQVQGRGSGLDLMTSLLGGLVRFQAGQLGSPLVVGAQFQHWLAVYCGYKVPTAQVLASVAKRYQTDSLIMDQVYRLMGAVVEEATQALQAGDNARLGRCMNINQGLLNALGVSDARLEALCSALRQDPRLSGAKISGSGLGDCVLALGLTDVHALTLREHSFQAFPLKLDLKGLIYA